MHVVGIKKTTQKPQDQGLDWKIIGTRQIVSVNLSQRCSIKPLLQSSAQTDVCVCSRQLVVARGSPYSSEPNHIAPQWLIKSDIIKKHVQVETNTSTSSILVHNSCGKSKDFMLKLLNIKKYNLLSFVKLYLRMFPTGTYYVLIMHLLCS